MNDIAKQSIMEKLNHNIEVEKLTNKAEIGRMLGINGTYLSMILNKSTWHKCPKSAWEAVLNWLNSGYTLAQFSEKFPVKEQPEKEAEQPLIKIKPGVLEARQKILAEREKEIEKSMEPILTPTFDEFIKIAMQGTDKPEKSDEQVIREAVKSHPLAVEALQPKQEFTDTARLKIALDIEINLVVNGHKVSML